MGGSLSSDLSGRLGVDCSVACESVVHNWNVTETVPLEVIVLESPVYQIWMHSEVWQTSGGK